MRFWILAGLIAVLGMTAVACGDDDPQADVQARFSEFSEAGVPAPVLNNLRAIYQGLEQLIFRAFYREHYPGVDLVALEDAAKTAAARCMLAFMDPFSTSAWDDPDGPWFDPNRSAQLRPCAERAEF